MKIGYFFIMCAKEIQFLFETPVSCILALIAKKGMITAVNH